MIISVCIESFHVNHARLGYLSVLKERESEREKRERERKPAYSFHKRLLKSSVTVVRARWTWERAATRRSPDVIKKSLSEPGRPINKDRRAGADFEESPLIARASGLAVV